MTTRPRRSFKKAALTVIMASLIITVVHQARADQMDSSNYQLQLEPVEVQLSSDSASMDNGPTLPTIPAENLAELKKQGYTILSGKDDQYSSQNFKLAISETNITFENTPNQSTQKKDIDLAVASDGSYGYQIIASQATLLMTMTGLTIKNTTCDSPLNSCSVSLANIWEGVTSYGFGYTIKGDDIPKDFKNEKYFRPFSENQDVTIMSEPMTELTRKSTMTMQLKTQAGQPEGSYHTTVRLLAVPKM